jgi:hypothetical protein
MGSIGSSKEIERGYYGISPTIGKQEVIKLAPASSSRRKKMKLIEMLEHNIFVNSKV